MIRKSVAKKIVIVSLIFVFLIALIGFGKYFYDKATDISSVNMNKTGQLVKRTSEPNGYSSQQSPTNIQGAGGIPPEIFLLNIIINTK